MNSLISLRRATKNDLKFLELLYLEKQGELLTEYDTKLFNYLVEKIIIHKGKRVEIHLKNGEVISIWYDFFFFTMRD